MSVDRREIKYLKKLASIKEGGSDKAPLGEARLNVQGLVKLELVERHGAGLRITPVGRAFLKRNEIESLAGNMGEEAYLENVFRSQHHLEQRLVRNIEGVRQHVNVNTAESPLGWLRSRKGKDGKAFITERQFEAGERFRTDFEMASLGARVTACWDGVRVTGQSGWREDVPDPTTAQVSARKRIHDALNALGGDLSDIVVRVCCFLEKMEEAERGLGWPTRSGKLVLAIALDRLADFYDKK